MINRNNKKGFTIVELVIVIAVIAILAAVLIPTFAGIIKKANISSDTQLCKNMNTALSMAKAEGKSVDTMEDVLFAINEAGYVIENLNPTTEGYYFAWDKKNGLILFLNEQLGLHYPDDATLNAADCWITVADDAEADKIAAKGFSLYLEPNFEGPLTLANLVSVDAGANANIALELTSDAEGTIAIRGSFSTVELAAAKAHVEQYGVANKVTGTVAKNTFVVNGFVQSLELTSGKVEVAATGVVKTYTAAADVEFAATSKGIIVSGAPAGYTSAANVTINNKAELEAFRDIVNGGYNYAGITVTLNADIDLAGVAWTPIGNFCRSDADKGNGFAGTFDGANHTVKNLSNTGFSISGLNLGNVATSATTINGVKYVETVYGLFGSVVGKVEIKNLSVANANIDMVVDYDAKRVGDSVGAIVGYVARTSEFTMTNCSASGTIKGHDAVGGLVGRSYANSTTISGGKNSANVTADGLNVAKGTKAAGICGYAGSINTYTISISGTNSGEISVVNTTASTPLVAKIYTYAETLADKTQKMHLINE